MRKGKTLLRMSIWGFAAMSGSILLMPFDLGILSGLLFWAGLAFGLACQWKLAAGKARKKGKWGAFTFFSGKEGKAVDTLLILSAVALTIAMAVDGYGYICYVLIAATLFAFCLHCIVNGTRFAELTAGASAAVQEENRENQKGGKRTR